MSDEDNVKDAGITPVETLTLGIYPMSERCDIPKYGTKGAACFDLKYQPTIPRIEIYEKSGNHLSRDISPEGELTIMPGDRALVPTGLILDIPEGYHVKMHVRSSTGIKLGLSFAHSTGIIDSDYTGELFMPLINNTDNRIKIPLKRRLAQAELCKSEMYDIVQLKKPPKVKGDRKAGVDGGLGSTGE